MLRLPLVLLLAVFAVAACSGDDSSVSEPAEVEQATTSTTLAELEPAIAGLENPQTVPEAFVAAFYTFDPDELSALPWADADSEAREVGYQAWAQAANYEVVEWSCTLADETLGNGDSVTVCPVTVNDDFGRALGYQATDTFRIATNADGDITLVISTGDDPPVFGAMNTWLQEEQPEVFAAGGPCSEELARSDLCSAAIAAGAAAYAETDEYVAP